MTLGTLEAFFYSCRMKCRWYRYMLYWMESVAGIHRKEQRPPCCSAKRSMDDRRMALWTTLNPKRWPSSLPRNDQSWNFMIPTINNPTDLPIYYTRRELGIFSLLSESTYFVPGEPVSEKNIFLLHLSNSVQVIKKNKTESTRWLFQPVAQPASQTWIIHFRPKIKPFWKRP